MRLMHFFQESVIPPDSSQQSLLDLLLVILYLIHYPYIGMTIGTALCSIALCLLGRDDPDGVYARAGGTIGDLVTFHKTALIFLGIVPMLAVTLINRQLLFASGIPVLTYQAAAILLSAAGLLFLSFYRKLTLEGERSFHKKIGTGALGLFLLLNGAFGFFAASARILDPEKWPFIDNALEFGLSWNAIASFKVFLASAICVTGAGLLFFLFNWERERAALAGAERRFLIYFSAGLTLAGALILPLVLLFFLVTAPEISLSYGVFISSLGVLVILMIIALTAYKVIRDGNPRPGVAAFILSLLMILGTIVTDHIARGGALREHSLALQAMAAEIEEEREAARAKLAGAKPARSGEEIFNEQCTVCHSFGVKIVGPPYLETVPAYQGDIEALKAYIKNPVKKRADYPRMPQLGLRDAAVDSVATYLLREVEARGK
jgi:cytochrome c